MKKLQSLFLGILIIIAVLLLGVRQLEKTSGMSGAKVLTISHWGDYIDPSLVTKFEKEYGYKVNYETVEEKEERGKKRKKG
ncbi:spermidine/putrescine ABC transporter substrate-binding protein, partial [Escherichia coli]